MANSKLTGLSATTSIDDADIIYVVTDVAGTPTSKKATVATLASSISVDGAQLAGLGNVGAGAGTVPIANLPYKDEDNMASDSAVHVPTQQSVKAYVDANAGGASATELSFVNADLSTGVLTVTHNAGLSAGYTAVVTVVNNSGAVVIPDAINTFAANSFKVDLTSYGTLSGTWYCTYIVKA